MPDAAIPYPPRFRQLKRLALLALLLLAFLVGLRIWWGYEADRRMQRIVAAAHARGEKILPADFVTAPIPDDRNAATLLINAAAAITQTPQEQAWDNAFPATLPLSATDVQHLSTFLSRNEKALALVRQARSMPDIDWRFDPTVPLERSVSGMMPRVSKARQLANLVGYAVLYQHHIGNDAGAVEHLFDLHFLQLAVQEMAPNILTSMAATGIGVIRDRRIETIAPTLDLAGPVNSSGAATTGPATHARVRELIQLLLYDEDNFRQATRHAWAGERMQSIAFARYFVANYNGSVLALPLQPAYELDAVRLAQAFDIDFPLQPNYPAAQSRLPPPANEAIRSTIHGTATVMSTIASGGIARPQQHLSFFRALADRRAAALLLALRLYALDHAGEFPQQVDALVPQYLPRLPLDPFAADDRPFAYIPSSPAGPAVYSVGRNGVDNGGATTAPDPYQSADAVYRLSRPRPTN